MKYTTLNPQESFDQLNMSGGVAIVSRTDSSRKSSNISKLVHKVARVYKLRPGYANPGEETEEPQSSTEVASEGSSGLGTPTRDGDDSEANSLKSQQSPSSDSNVVVVKVQVMETLISNIFTTVSALKNAYMQLQAAHSPYNVEKLQTADRAVINELRTLSELKHSYRDRDAALTGGQLQDGSSLTGGQLQEVPSQAELQNRDTVLKSYEGIINNFHSEIQKKNAEMEKLKDVLAQTILKKEKLERRVRRLEQKFSRDSCVNISNDISPTSHLFEATVQGASEAVRSFTKLLLTMMKAAQWDLDAASNSIEPGISYPRRSHKKYAFESYVCHRLLNGFENENFYISGSLSSVLDPEKHRQECFNQFQDMKNTDPQEIVTAQPDCLFGKFCHKKFVDLVHPKMEESFFGSLEHRNQVGNGTHPRTQFYENFLRLAKAMWLVHRLAFAFNPIASIFQVRRDTEFSPLYMESVVDEDSGLAGSQKVGFTVMPGFRVEKTLIKCRVYIVPMNVTD